MRVNRLIDVADEEEIPGSLKCLRYKSIHTRSDRASTIVRMLLSPRGYSFRVR